MIKKLAESIGYPERVADGASVFTFHVDGGSCVAAKIGGRLVLRRDLDVEPDDLPVFASYAAGRMLREEAVLAYDEREERAFLWQEIPAGADGAALKAAFEDFADSCDWWLQRTGELHAPPSVFPDIMIRP